MQYRTCPGATFGLLCDNPVEVLNEHQSLLVECYVPTKVIRVCNKDKPIGLMINAGMLAVLMNVQSPHKWWSTFKSSVFGPSSSLPPLVNEGGGLVCESDGKADLLSNHFDSKHSREAVDLPLTCHPSQSLTTFALGRERSDVSC